MTTTNDGNPTDIHPVLPEPAPITGSEAQALRERVAELEREANNRRAAFKLLDNAHARLQQHIDFKIGELSRLRAESVIEWEPGRSHTAAELLRRAIRGLRVRKGRSICPAVENLFGCGNTVARYLCRWAGRDPDTGKDIAARKGEGSEGAAQAKEGAE